MDTCLNYADWTVLIYANGNNDLEPEMHKAMLDAEKTGSFSAFNVLMQIGTADERLVKLIRRDIIFLNDNEKGVRRYYIHKGKSELLEYMGNVNMSDPKQLYNFVKWGILNYPAKRYMLITGGHSYHCVGLMTDYSGNMPYIMGIPEMVKAIDAAAGEAGNKIDILILDACCSNSLELLYEFGRNKNNAVKNIITYLTYGPIEGLPYNIIIDSMKAINAAETSIIIKSIINSLPMNLIGFSVDHNKLELIKRLFNEMSANCLRETDENNINRIQKKIIKSVGEASLPIIIHYKKAPYCSLPLITVTSDISGNEMLMKNYYRLGFAQNNNWTKLFSDKLPAANTKYNENMLPLEISRHEVVESIAVMNPELDRLQIARMADELYEYKKWTM